MGSDMMTRALLERCREAGLQIRLHEGTLQVRPASGNSAPTDLLEDLRSHRAAVVEYLLDARRARAHPCDCCGRFFYAEPAVVCYWCRTREESDTTAPKPATWRGNHEHHNERS